jgi:hypothetical protein
LGIDRGRPAQLTNFTIGKQPDDPNRRRFEFVVMLIWREPQGGEKKQDGEKK